MLEIVGEITAAAGLGDRLSNAACGINGARPEAQGRRPGGRQLTSGADHLLG